MQDCIFVVFGGTGDLTHRKLLPALYRLRLENLLPGHFAVVAVGRREKNDIEYRTEAEQSIQAAAGEKIDRLVLNSLVSQIHYRQVEFAGDGAGYRMLRQDLEALDNQCGTGGNRLFFLAVAPEFFAVITNKLLEQDMLKNAGSWQRLMIEKPFGSNLATATDLNQILTAALPENHIFRIDHYLGKEMIQNILAIRFGNALFEPLWNHHYIDNVQIISTETLGVEGRGGYYEQSGIRRDMLQNHLLQMLAMIAMEPPVNLEPESIRDEKVKVLRSLRRFDRESIRTDIVRGQYGPGEKNGQLLSGYRQEERVAPDSRTDTFIALKVYVDNFRWAGVPFYILAGKRLNRQVTQIIIEFKKLPGIEFYADFKNQKPNLLVVEIQPQEGLLFQINAKHPGNEYAMERIDLNYCQNCQFAGNSPEAYERLILEATRNNQALFTRWDELTHAWAFVDSIEDALQDIRPQVYPNYPAGSPGPAEAEALIAADGRNWWDISH